MEEERWTLIERILILGDEERRLRSEGEYEQSIDLSCERRRLLDKLAQLILSRVQLG